MRETLIRSALQMLESGEPFSLRALARDAGVSTAAPYRHFADREELESALAVHGLQELMRDLTADREPPATAEDIGEVAVRYVRFAMRRPALFHLMFGQPCDDQNDERVRAAAALRDYLREVMARVFPQSEPDALATAGWSLAHGLAFLHLDGKLPNTDPDEIDKRVRSAFAAVFPPVARAETTRRRTNRAKPDHDKPNRSASNRSTSNHTESSIQ
ncbi:TetR/AcrR family transcriptional regulator [Bifidobacterium tibiigranuli]|uniref:TetR/AcrR family transcriptional regulator n=1 Tax=Bifidobacterium tibiigranuli TaxID=2172043 RepID=UPI0026EC61E5|nr:TetR/AcrR family transcriptional regulator [Bifidobacterium tibiigranuli]MCI2185384.1 WHG domain-containing protein [Bifidobacterium tibiigranuli]MCI2203641.1 WHG domain-containing protein [Bifidobacterium tibiigranuli]